MLVCGFLSVNTGDFMKKLLILVTITSYFLSFRSFGMLKCPEHNPTYQEIINRLETFSKNMKISNACKAIQNEIQLLQSNLSVIGPFFVGEMGNESVKLSVAELNALSNNSSLIIAKSKSIVDQLLVQPQCMEEYGVSTIQIISSIANQISSLTSAFLGPYGIPISLSGGAISGILQGLDLLIKKHNYGYNFHKSQYRNLFVTNLCTYHNIRNEIIDMLYPSIRILSYQILIDELNIRKNQLIKSIPLGFEYQNTYLQKESAYISIENIKNIIEKQSNESIWERCLMLANIVHEPDSDLTKLVSDLSPDSTNIFHSVFQLYSFAKGPDGVLSSKKCWQKGISSLQELNLRSTSIIFEILNNIEHSYQKKINSMGVNSKNDPDNNNNIKILEETLRQSKWAKEEYMKLQRLLGENSFQDRKELSTFKKKLDKRFFSKLAPNFIRWYQKEAKISVNRYKRYLKKYSLRISRNYYGFSFWSKGLQYQEILKKSMVEHSEDQDIHRVLYANTENLLTQLINAHLAISTIQDYQDYFAKYGTLSKDLIQLRGSKKIIKVKRYIENQLNITKLMIKYLYWCHKQKYVSADYIKILIDKIRNTDLKNTINDEKNLELDELDELDDKYSDYFLKNAMKYFKKYQKV